MSITSETIILHPNIPKEIAAEVLSQLGSFSSPHPPLSDLAFELKLPNKDKFSLCEPVDLLRSSDGNDTTNALEYSFPRLHSDKNQRPIVIATRDISAKNASPFFAVKPVGSMTFADLRGMTFNNSNDNSALLRRLASICGINQEKGDLRESGFETLKSSVFARCWRFAEVLPLSCFPPLPLISGIEEIEPAWSFMDEMLSTMTMTEDNIDGEANFDCWLCYAKGEPVFILHPKRDIKAGEKIISDCFYQNSSSSSSALRQLLRFSDPNSTVSDFILSQNNPNNFLKSGRADSATSTAAVLERQAKRYQTLLAHCQLCPKVFANFIKKIAKNKRLFFYSDSKAMVESVTDPRYIALTVDDAEQKKIGNDDDDDGDDEAAKSAVINRADIVYLVHSKFARSDEFPNAKFISQFPEERLFVDKAGLARTVNENLGFDWKYIPKSFVFCSNSVSANEDCIIANEETAEGTVNVADHFPMAFLLKFLMTANHKQRKQTQPPSSLWMAKSTNLSRSMGHLVLDSLPWLIRSNESIPRVLCEYIDRPLLVRGGKKFDVRFYVLVNSLGLFSPPSSSSTSTDQQSLPPNFESEIYLYKDIFPRVALSPFSVDSATLHKSDTHFTWSLETDWSDPAIAERKPDGDVFIEEFFNRQFGASAWQDKVMPQIRAMLKEFFSKGVPLVGIPEVCGDTTPCSVIESYWTQRQRFRGMYGCDVMVRYDGDDDDQEETEESYSPVLLECTYQPNSQGPLRADPNFFNHVFNTMFRNEPSPKMEKL